MLTITLRVVYNGIAIINPKTPNSNPEKIITKKTSSGWDLMDDEKMKGWSKKLSRDCTIEKPITSAKEVFKNSLITKTSMLLVKDKVIINIILINGPK